MVTGYIKLDTEFGASLGYKDLVTLKKKIHIRRVPNLVHYELSWKGENNRGSA